MKIPQLGKYYLIFGVLMAFTIAMVIFTISKAPDAKTDKNTAAKMAEIASKLNEFMLKNNQLPATLDDAGVNNIPDTITYSKAGLSQYQICAYYKSSGSSFGSGWVSQLN